jgi:Enoyl-CoA hydratase/isomerase
MWGVVETVLYDKRDRMAFVTLNRPAVKNAIDPRMHDELCRIWRDFRDDDEVDVAILSGAGGTFCAGADLRTYVLENYVNATPRQPEHPDGARRAVPGRQRGYRVYRMPVLEKIEIDSVISQATASGSTCCGGCASVASGSSRCRSPFAERERGGSKNSDALGTRSTTLSQMDAYSMAKLALIPWIYGLARRWADSGVTANALDPGWAKTEMGTQFEGPALQRWPMSTVNRLFGASHQKGSKQYLSSLVGTAGFEPTAAGTPDRRTTKLRHIPMRTPGRTRPCGPRRS